uniref:Putative HNH homing endonuclease n=1 Tax=Colemanosphaera charkowiensis TaxID=51706 RepID=A0A6C0RXK5_9CHLO|nr:putative HNH homing endonuclease [Colemanosphaera charkowiensis]QIA47075.1 putative HNH nucleases [Colemanosphaera charkowiensis]
MPISRGQKLTKISVSELNNIVQERNHVLLQVITSKRNPDYVPKQSKIHLRCLKCNYEWETKVYVYLERLGPSLGCRQCYKNMIQDPSIYPNSPCRKNQINKNKSGRRVGREVLRVACKNGQFGHIQNVKQLMDYLKNNPNAYNTKVLSLIIRNEGLKKHKIKLKDLYPGEISMHHVIPLHANGSPDLWNIIPVTKEEHHELHQLRYAVYGEKADLQATFATQSDIIKARTGCSQKIKQIPKQNTSGIRNIPLEVANALKQGMICIHKDGYAITIQPNTLQTTQDVKNTLVNLLPEDHKDRQRILQNKTSVNYIRSLIITTFPLPTTGTLKKQVQSAYGFTLQPLLS